MHELHIWVSPTPAGCDSTLKRAQRLRREPSKQMGSLQIGHVRFRAKPVTWEKTAKQPAATLFKRQPASPIVTEAIQTILPPHLEQQHLAKVTDGAGPPRKQERDVLNERFHPVSCPSTERAGRQYGLHRGPSDPMRQSIRFHYIINIGKNRLALKVIRLLIGKNCPEVRTGKFNRRCELPGNGSEP
jgi:hypothetical protein